MSRLKGPCRYATLSIERILLRSEKHRHVSKPQTGLNVCELLVLVVSPETSVMVGSGFGCDRTRFPTCNPLQNHLVSRLDRSFTPGLDN